MSKSIYKITILNWSKHNSKHKDSFKKTLIANNFCTDAKILALPLSVAWLYLGLLLIAGNENQETIKVGSKTIQELLRSKLRSIQALNSLQEIQLLTYEEIASLNRIEEKEKNRNENKRIPARSENPFKELNSQIWDTYASAYFDRYKVQPTRNASVNAKISQIAKRLGTDSLEVVRFYLKHNDAFYLKNTHSIGLCLSQAESLHTQWKRNQPVTAVDVRNFEKKQNIAGVEEAIRNGENF